MAAYRLSDLSGQVGVPRILHGLAARSPLTFARRAAELTLEVGTAGILDLVSPLQARILEAAPGLALPSGTSLALYLHWSPDGRVSGMVQRQLRLWRESGFNVVFITNAAQRPPAGDWQVVAEQTILRIHRSNVGRDFGAWRDGLELALSRFGEPEELLLANDGVLGPFLPLEPLVGAWRAGGDGCFGLTESLGGGAHLQSYALLARGKPAVGAMRAHLAAFRDSRSKWRVVQQGELGLTRRMQAAGVRCAALFGYARLLAEVDDATRETLGPRFATPEALERYPLNPCHHLWRVLVERLHFPYLKTELVLRNPGRLPGVSAWRDLVPASEARLISDHLDVMAGKRETGPEEFPGGSRS